MQSKYKALIFDLDGTLLDTLEDLKNSVNKALKNNGYDISYTYDQAKWLIGSGTKKLCERSIEKFNPTKEENEKVFNDFTNFYKEKQLENTIPYPNVKEALFRIKQEGYKICVLSNKTEENVYILLETLLPEISFDIIRGQVKHLPKKPDPTILKMMIEELKIMNNEVLYIGDSDVDMIVADKLNIDKVAVTYGYRPIEILKQYNPNYIVNDVLEILEIVKNK